MKFLIIAKKEIIDITRDRRTLFMMIAFPLLLMPVMIGSMLKITSSQAKKASLKELKVAFIGEEFAPNLYNAFSNLDKLIILDQIPIDSVQSYIQSEYLDAAININPIVISSVIRRYVDLIWVFFSINFYLLSRHRASNMQSS